MKPIKAVINEHCRQAQLRALETLSKPSTLTLDQAAAQCHAVLKEAENDETSKPE